ncbi:hypothetical protein GIB67_020430, partial [Kingdonia uniflora]
MCAQDWLWAEIKDPSLVTQFTRSSMNEDVDADQHIPRNKTCPSIKETEENQKGVSEEPPKDYVHVRARRGEAIDSHSLTERESFDESTDSSDVSGGLMCHQCRRNDTERVYWCLKCDRRGYCDSYISK